MHRLCSLIVISDGERTQTQERHSIFHVSNVQRQHLEAVEAFTFCLESNYKHV